MTLEMNNLFVKEQAQDWVNVILKDSVWEDDLEVKKRD